MTAPLIFPLGTDQTFGIVDAAYNKWSKLAVQAFEQAQQLAVQIGDIPITPVTFDAAFSPQLALPGFQVPTSPVTPTMVFNAPSLPPQPPVPDTPAINLSAAPVYDVVQPVYQPPGTPQLSLLSDPGSAPTLTDPTMPVAPDYVLPQVPVLAALHVPDMPVIVTPAFTATAPVFNAPIPAENFIFEPQPYVDALLDQTKATLSEMMSGDFVLPAAVASAIRNRAYESANREEFRSIDAAYAEFGARGFEEPPGLLLARLSEAHDKAQEARMGTNRDVYVQDQQVALENLRFAVTGGIQLEGQLIQLHISEIQMQFEAAKFALDVAIQILQARVSVYNAQIQAYGVEAEVFRDRIQAALAQAQVYSTQMEGVRIQGELNMQQVQIYTAQLQGIHEMVAIYSAQVQAAEVESRINMSRVQVFSAKVDAFKAQVDAQTAQWQGYRAQVDAQLGAAQFYQTSVNAYGSRVQAWATGEGAKQKAADLKIEQSKLYLDTWHGKVELFEEQLKGELARLATVKDIFSTQVEKYRGDVSATVAGGEYNNRRFQLNLAQEQAIVATSLKRSEASFEQMRFITSIALEIKKTLAMVESQLAASAMNAVNIGATASASGTQSLDWSTGVSISESGEDF